MRRSKKVATLTEKTTSGCEWLESILLKCTSEFHPEIAKSMDERDATVNGVSGGV